jgi:hypothetical protein
MPRWSAALMLLSGCACLAAQAQVAHTVQLPDGQSSATASVVLLPAPTCPVRMHALQGSGSGLVQVRNAPPDTRPTQRIHLILATEQTPKVAAARVTVRGLSGRDRAVPTPAAMGLTPDRTRTLEVRFSPESATEVAADLVLPGFTAMLSVQLDSLTYSDGSIWVVPGTQACHVAPDPLMLVSGR